MLSTIKAWLPGHSKAHQGSKTLETEQLLQFQKVRCSGNKKTKEDIIERIVTDALHEAANIPSRKDIKPLPFSEFAKAAAITKNNLEALGIFKA